MMARVLRAMHIPISDHLSLRWHELSTKKMVFSLARRSRTGILRPFGSIPALNCAGGNDVGITMCGVVLWPIVLSVGTGVAKAGVFSSGIVSPTVDEFVGTG